jgi:Sigma-70 region 2
VTSLPAGASPAIDSCAGMIAGQALKAYGIIAPEQKRWLDLEDLQQEGMLAALLAERSFVTGRGTKYSTWLFPALRNQMSRVISPLVQRKRDIAPGHLLELDAPLETKEGSLGLELPAPTETGPESCLAEKAIVRMCTHLGGQAMALVVGGLLTGHLCRGHHRQAWFADVFPEIRSAARLEGVGVEDVATVLRDDFRRKKVLTSLANSDTIGLDTDIDIRVLECVECAGQFPLSALRDGRFVVETSTCRRCYKALQKSSPAKSCFGKFKSPTTEGYSEADAECRLHCRDRRVCRQYASKPRERTTIMVDELEDNEITELEDADFEGVDQETEEKPKAKPAKKAEKAPKPAKAAKPAKADKPVKAKAPAKEEDAPPPEVGPRWPYKAGSALRTCFQMCYKGCKQKDLIDLLNRTGHKSTVPLMLRNMRHNFYEREITDRFPTHDWKLNEEGGRFKIFAVKYLGKDKAPKAEKPAAKPEPEKKAAKKAKKADKPAKKAKK